MHTALSELGVFVFFPVWKWCRAMSIALLSLSLPQDVKKIVFSGTAAFTNSPTCCLDRSCSIGCRKSDIRVVESDTTSQYSKKDR